MEGAIVSIALLIFLAHVFSALFVKTRLPDVLPLMLLGILLGPALKVVSPQDFGVVDKVFTRILLIIILFESGLGIRISQIRSIWGQGLRLTVVSFILTAAAIAGTAVVMLGLPLPYALILGCILADNSFAIIIPLVSKLKISENIRTTLLVESTFNSVFSIGCSIALLGMVQAGVFSPGLLAAKIIYSFFMSLVVGSIAALFWTAALSKIRLLENDISLTLAFVMVVYFVCEIAGADGAIGAFIFGIIAGNIRVIRRLLGFQAIEHITKNVSSKPFNDMEKSFFSEVIFILRTFFFVYIGISMQINSLYSMLCGLVLTAVVFLVRVPAVNYMLDKSVDRLDASVAGAMVPKGLVTAVLASMVVQSGISKADILQDAIYSIILLSIIAATVISFMIEKGYVKPVSDFLYKRHQQYVPPAEQPKNS